MKLWIACLCLALSACATQLTEAGSKVKVSRSAEDVAACKRVKFIYENRAGGADGIADAKRGAINDAASAGANTVYFESASMGARGASVVATAYNCN